jgi:hypothetical protein
VLGSGDPGRPNLPGRRPIEISSRDVKRRLVARRGAWYHPRPRPPGLWSGRAFARRCVFHPVVRLPARAVLEQTRSAPMGLAPLRQHRRKPAGRRPTLRKLSWKRHADRGEGRRDRFAAGTTARRRPVSGPLGLKGSDPSFGSQANRPRRHPGPGLPRSPTPLPPSGHGFRPGQGVVVASIRPGCGPMRSGPHPGPAFVSGRVFDNTGKIGILGSSPTVQ